MNGKQWDEMAAPRATSARGWYLLNGLCYGHYLDYGPDHHRSSHEWCRGRCTCRLSQPGNLHAVRFKRTGRDSTGAYESRYFERIEDAKAWIEEYNPPA